MSSPPLSDLGSRPVRPVRSVLALQFLKGEGLSDLFQQLLDIVHVRRSCCSGAGQANIETDFYSGNTQYFEPRDDFHSSDLNILSL